MSERKEKFDKANAAMKTFGEKMTELAETIDENLLTVDQAAALLPLKTTTIRTFCRQQRIPRLKIGKSYFIEKSTIVSLLDGSLEVGPPPAVDEFASTKTPDEV